MQRSSPSPQVILVALGDMTPVQVAGVAGALAAGPWPVIALTTKALRFAVIDVLPPADCQWLDDQATMGGALMDAVSLRPHAPAWLLVPGDVAHAQVPVLQALLDGLAHNPIAFSQVNGRRCYPAAFASDLYGDLMRVHDDEQLRRLLARYPGQGVNLADVQPSGFPMSEFGPAS